MAIESVVSRHNFRLTSLESSIRDLDSRVGDLTKCVSVLTNRVLVLQSLLTMERGWPVGDAAFTRSPLDP